MPEKKTGTKQTLSSPGHARRHFLEKAALATVGASVVTVLPAVSRAENHAELPPSGCPDEKIPMTEVSGKVAFITGGSSGIGLGIARAFADAGMKVVIGYRTPKHLEEAMKYLAGAGQRIHAINVDVTDRPGMEQAARETAKVFGKVHVLVNNAGVNLPIPISKITYDDWDWVMNVNLTGVFNGVHAFLPHIRSNGEGGKIITTSSLLGLITAAEQCAYSASKYAVVGMMEALRADLIDSNVGVSVFCPGLVTSNVFESARNRPGHLSDSGFKPDEEEKARQKKMRDDPQYAMPALEAGQLVLRGMRNNDLYILPPRSERLLQERHEALIASIPQDSQPTGAGSTAARSNASKSMYARERDRKLCARAARAAVTQ